MYKNLISSFRVVRKVLTFLGNLQLAIFLLLLLAILSSLGTLIEQDKVVSFYELNYPISKPILGFINSDLILFLGLDHIYSASWFIFIILLFGTSLMSCTFTRQIPSFKLAKLWKFFKEEKKVSQLNLTFNLLNSSLTELSYLLKLEHYNIIQQGPYIYAYKGLIGKIGPILVHISIILVLLGSIYGVLTGFMLQEVIPKGQLFHLQNVIVSGPLSYINQDFQAYVNDFKISYTDEGLIDQFYSDLSILDNDLTTRLKKTIFVNEPLTYNNLTLYQTDWNITGIEILINEVNKVNIPLKEIQLKPNSRFWIGELSFNKKILLILQDLTGNYLIYNSDKRIIGEGEIGHKIYIDGTTMRTLKVVPSTGLQIKSDPGITIVYIGFLFLIVSVTISYTSYCQIWAIKKDTQLYVYGTTNRGVYFFEKDLVKLLGKLNKKSNVPMH